MVSVEEAEKIILGQIRDFGKEHISFEQAHGRVLADALTADRDLPPFNRVAMDGIAIRYEAFEQGRRTFRVAATQAAGDSPFEIKSFADCIEIMTGASLSPSTDTVIRYEDISLQDGVATVLLDDLTKGQNIHLQGKDKKSGEVVAAPNQVIGPALVGMVAAIGKTSLPVKVLPRIVIISTGDELVDIHQTPLPFQIRRSNNYTIQAALQKYKVQADLRHIPDNIALIRKELEECLRQYDVVLLSGGISMGKFDYVPQVLEDLLVEKLFHKVHQRPGKPFWLGKHANGAVVFALPGNPASTFMCFRRYVLPWLESSLGIATTAMYAVLERDITFNPPLQYFLQVQLRYSENGQVLAMPLEGNGSGDFANLVEANAFMELPKTQSIFKAGEVFRIWPF